MRFSDSKLADVVQIYIYTYISYIILRGLMSQHRDPLHFNMAEQPNLYSVLKQSSFVYFEVNVSDKNLLGYTR